VLFYSLGEPIPTIPNTLAAADIAGINELYKCEGEMLLLKRY